MIHTMMPVAVRPNSPRFTIKAVAPVSLSLRETIDYTLEAKGSGFRLKLAQAAGAANGLSPKVVTDLAEGIEHFHHASLIFDDLPCMDDASERRGKRCVHRVAGEAQAILAALALVNRAYTMCWKAAAQFPDQCAQAARLVERSIGELGVLEGQARDLSFDPSLGASEVKAIAAGKTGALLQLTVLLPAVLAGVSFGELLRITRVARYWGIAYQGLDDFQDLCLSGAASGKTPFRDVAQQRPNLVVALGVSEAYQELHVYLLSAGAQIDQLIEIDSKWAFLADFHACLTGKESALVEALETMGQ
jgi:geranylgeranyl diphosphate synthase type II